jgi:hypothetical protein
MSPSELLIYNTCVMALSQGTFRVEAGYPEGVDLSAAIGKLIAAIHYGHPELFYVTDEIKHSYGSGAALIEMYSKYRPSDIDRMRNELKAVVDEIVTELEGVHDHFERIYALNEHFCNNITYTSRSNTETGDAYGALVIGTARCEGIAKAVKIILDRLGYKSIILHGSALIDGLDEPHAWNIAEVDGRWYQFDFTWCISRTPGDIKIPSVEYLFLTDAEMSLEHFPDVTGFPESFDNTKAFWELKKSVVRYSADFERVKPIAYGHNYRVVAKLLKKPDAAEVDEMIDIWYRNEMSGHAISRAYSYTYNELLGILTLYFLNE